MKVAERIFEKRLRNVVKIDEMQMKFMPRREAIDAIFILQQMLENMKWQKESCICDLLIWKNRLIVFRKIF